MAEPVSDERQKAYFERARKGVLTPGASAPGRGVYTCHRLQCFERAVSSRGFARTLRRPVEVDPGLARLYTRGQQNG